MGRVLVYVGIWGLPCPFPKQHVAVRAEEKTQEVSLYLGISFSDSELEPGRRMGGPECSQSSRGHSPGKARVSLGWGRPGHTGTRAHTHTHTQAVFPSKQKVLPLAELEGPIPFPARVPQHP